MALKQVHRGVWRELWRSDHETRVRVSEWSINAGINFLIISAMRHSWEVSENQSMGWSINETIRKPPIVVHKIISHCEPRILV